MFTFVKSSYKPKKPRAQQNPRPRKLARPSGHQYNVLRDVEHYLRETRGKRREIVYAELVKRWGLHVSELRMPIFGGVGTSKWMPLRKCYRVQVGAGHINRKGAFYNYAPCVEIYDY